MTTIPIQLSDVDLEKIDRLVKLGRYKNRSQAIKAMLREKLDQETIVFEWENDEDKEVQAQLLKLALSKKESILTWNSQKTAAQLIREDRDR